MGLISIGSHTFVRNPYVMTPLESVRQNTYVITYSSVSHFSWGFTNIGKLIDLKWNYMSETEYQQIRTIHLEDVEKLLNPNDGSLLTYNVQLLDFNGIHSKGRGTDTTAVRLNINLQLLIISVN